MLTLLLALAAHAAEPVHPDWGALAPWRTWLVVDDVTPAHDWFALDAGPGQRCQVRVGDPDDWPVVSCGEAVMSEAGRRQPTGARRELARRAARALARELDRAVRPGDLTWLGRLRRVSFRQVVVVQPDPAPGASLARVVEASWDVDLDTGRVDRSAAAERVRTTHVCQPGMHPGCDAPPRLAAWSPPARFEGLLLVGDDPGASAPDRDALEAAVRAVAQEGWRPTPPRDIAPGLLPAGYDAALGVALHVRTRGGDEGSGVTTLELPLNQAVAGPVSARLPVDGAPVVVEVELRLREGLLAVRLRPHGGRYIEETAPVRCDLVEDGDRAALPRACEVDWNGRWLTWGSPDGRRGVMLQVGDALEPLPGPSRGVGLR